MKVFGRLHEQKHSARSLLRANSTSSAERCRMSSQRFALHEEDRLKKNRRIVDNHIRRMSDLFGRSLSLNNKGMAFFTYKKKFIIVLEVPSTHSDLLFIYSMVCHLGLHDDHRDKVLEATMKLNYMQHATRGATLGLEREEINLCHTISVGGFSACSLRGTLTDFMTSVEEIHEHLEMIKGAREEDLSL